MIQGRFQGTQPEAVNSTKSSPLSSPEHIQMAVHRYLSLLNQIDGLIFLICNILMH